ncbi:MAG: 50S ribosomal protein L15 [Candidatus Saccharimonadales bacterium]
MKYHQLTANPNRKSKRVGRGISAGGGKTAGRGTKGQKSRAGSGMRPGFSGGQNPLMQQLPKLPGFRSLRPKAEIVNLSQLAAIKDKVIDARVLADNNLISSPFIRVKLLSNGEIKTAKTVKLPAASQRAIDAVSKAGGSFEKSEQLKRPKRSSDSKS